MLNKYVYRESGHWCYASILRELQLTYLHSHICQLFPACNRKYYVHLVSTYCILCICETLTAIVNRWMARMWLIYYDLATRTWWHRISCWHWLLLPWYWMRCLWHRMITLRSNIWQCWTSWRITTVETLSIEKNVSQYIVKVLWKIMFATYVWWLGISLSIRIWWWEIRWIISTRLLWSRYIIFVIHFNFVDGSLAIGVKTYWFVSVEPNLKLHHWIDIITFL